MSVVDSAAMAAIWATLGDTAGDEQGAMTELESMLLRSSTDEPSGTFGRELSVERVALDAEPAPDRHLQFLERLAGRVAESIEYRVFRREVPVGAPTLDLSTPAWGRGAAVERTLGPFRDRDGRNFWFDFYRLVSLVPVYLAGDPQAALLFNIHEHPLGPGEPFAMGQALRLLRRRRYELNAGSVWVRADLLAPGAPASSYVGLRIKGGSLAFTPPPIDAGGRLTIPAGGQCAVEVDLDTPAAPLAGGAKARNDAASAELTLPATLAFVLASGATVTTLVAASSWTLYGQHIGFTWAEDVAAVYEPALQSVLVPLVPDLGNLETQNVTSPFAPLAGRARIDRAGWALPVAVIDVANPTAAAGGGALAAHTEPGITVTWQGLRDGPMRLRAPWVTLAPGLIAVEDAEASGGSASQTLRLWKDADSRFRSDLRLRWDDAFSIRYMCSADGVEQLLAQTHAVGAFDRPVDTGGTPLEVRTNDSLLVLAWTETSRLAFLYDDNILADGLDPQAAWPADAARHSLAIRNALFLITPVNSLFLFAELGDEETVQRGSVIVGMGMFGVIPTLPDPYAANIGPLRDSERFTFHARRPSQLLVATVSWAKGATDAKPDQVEVRFSFAPLDAQAQPLAESVAAEQLAAEQFAVPATGTPTVGAFIVERQSDSAIWDRYFNRFSQEQFSLLDVSTNADQMGVSFAWFNPRDLDERDLVFYRVYGVSGAPAPYVPLQIRDLDLSAQSRYVRAFTVPQLSWEPLLNLTPPTPGFIGDPPEGFDLFPDDGGPTRLMTDSVELVPIAPIPVTEFLVRDFDERDRGFTGALFTLPFGLHAFAEFSRENQFQPGLDAAKVDFNRPEYGAGALVGGLQLRVDAPKHPAESAAFAGSTLQLDNLLAPNGTPTGTGTLGKSVGEIFNAEFFYDGATGYKSRGVPLTRIDFSGYGASIFSHWLNPNAAIAATSQARFDVGIGRTAHEVIQVRSLLYPWGVHVVRTITMFRTSSAYVYRYDTGWQAESDGIYDFRWTPYDSSFKALPQPNPYEIHPGIVRGVFKVRNIHETNSVPNFTASWVKPLGAAYVDDLGRLQTVDATTPASERSPAVNLQPVWFDADIEIDGVKSGAVDGRVASTGMLGFVQLAPRGEPLSPDLFAQLLGSQFGALGGPLSCVIDIGASGQHMRVSRIDVNASKDASGTTPIFVAAARGAVVLPKDGSWSVVQHDAGTGEVAPLGAGTTVPLIRRGRLDSDSGTTDAVATDLLRLANPIELVRVPVSGTRNYGLLQSTGTQKALFRLPSFQTGINELMSAPPDFADSYRLINSKGIFPNVQDALPLALGAFKTKILEQGYRLLDTSDPNRVFEQVLSEGPLFLINEDFLKLYVEYARTDKSGGKLGDGTLRYGFDAGAATAEKAWLSKVNDIGMVVDLGPLTRLMMIRGRFDAEKGASPAFIQPELVFSDALQPVIDILEVLSMLQGGDYAAALQKGLEVAMSNSADSWSYAFHARKEIPVVKFPPGALYDNPTNPFKLEAHLAVGVYFNEALRVTSDPSQLVPSAGAFLEFGGRLSVMCVSLAAATIYATGSVDLRTSADIKTGPALNMKFGFGAEIVVGLPVVGTVSLLYMVGVEIDLDSSQITVSGFLLFRGRAELLDGLVTVTIQIEAKGSVRRIAASDRTDMIAQVTFGLDISIFLVINISFSESWQESRQIA